MRYNFLFIFVLVVLALTIFASFVRFKKLTKKNNLGKKTALISHTEAIRELPEYKKAKRNYKLLVSLGFIFLAISLICCTILTSRPVIADYEKSEQNDRDILLCLDISGSMYESDATAAAVFLKMVDELKGQRIGVSVFGTNHASILPLNNDYDSTKEFLESLIKYDSSATSTYDKYPALDKYSSAVGASTNILGGVGGCVMDFSDLDSKRSRSLIVITDNVDNTSFGEDATSGNGESIHKALNLAKRYGIVAYGFNPGDYSSEGRETTFYTASSFKNAVLDTGGSYYSLNAFIEPWDYNTETYEQYRSRVDSISDINKASEIVSRILEEDAAKHQSEGELVLSDRPNLFLIISIASIICFAFIIWRLHL